MGVGALTGGTYRWLAAAGLACLLISLTATSPAVAAPGRLDTSFGHDGIAGAILEPHYGQTAFDSVSEEVGGSLLAARRGIVRRYSSTGVLDTSYAPTKQTFPEPVAPATQPDGKTLVNAGDDRVERLNPDGTPDQSFHGGESEAVEMSIAAIAVLPSGRILVAGTAQYLFIAKKSEYQLAVARFNSDGTIDRSFGNAGLVKLRSEDGYLPPVFRKVFPLPGEALLLVSGEGVIKLGPDGRPDPSYGSGGIAELGEVQVLDAEASTEGQLALAGTTASHDFFLAHLGADGRPDPGFAGGGIQAIDPGGVAEAHSILWGADGSVLIGGGSGPAAGCETTSTGCQGVPLVAHFDAAGTPDPGFGDAGLMTLTRLAGSVSLGGVLNLLARPGGGVIAAGGGGPEGSVAFLAALEANGSLESSFADAGLLEEREGVPSEQIGTAAIAVAPNGKILVADSDDSGPSDGGPTVFRYTPDGHLDRSFGRGKGYVLAPGYGDVAAIAVGPGGGSALLTRDPGTMVRITPEGRVDRRFGVGSPVEFHGNVAHFGSIAFQPHGRVLVAGTTDWVGEHGRMLVMRFLPDGRPDPSFGRDGRATTRCTRRGSCRASRILVEPGGKILLAGRAAGPYPAHGSRERASRIALARLLPDGSTDPGFGRRGLVTLRVGIRSEADAIATRRSQILLAGWANFGRGKTAIVTRLGADGHLDPGFGKAGVVRGFARGGAIPTEILPTARRLLVCLRAKKAVAPVVALDLNGHLDRSYRRLPAHVATPRLVSGPTGALQKGKVVLVWTQGPRRHKGGPITLKLSRLER